MSFLEERVIHNAANWAALNPVVPGENNVGESHTVPGQGITPREVITRYINHKQLPQMNGVYSDNHLLPDNFERMDKVQRAELAVNMLHLIKDRQARMQARRNRPKSAPAETQQNPPSEAAPQDAPPLGDGGKQKP